MSFMWLNSLGEVEANHQTGFEIWKPFEMHFGNGEGICHIDVFCIFAKIAIVTMSKFVRLILGTFWTNMEAQE